MPNTGRPSKDCHLCRSRRVKCDLGRPACQRCIRYGAECPGYRDQHELVFRNADPTTLKKRKRRARQEAASWSTNSKSSGSTPAPATPSIFLDDTESSSSSSSIVPDSTRATSLQGSDNETALCIPQSLNEHWTSHSVPIILNVYSTLDFIHIMYKNNFENGPLLWAAHLFSRTYMTNLRYSAAMHRDSAAETNQELGTYLGKTLSSVSQALKSPDGAFRDDVLATVWILANYELLIGSLGRGETTSPWHLHTRGLYSILKTRGSQMLYTETGRLAFWPAYNLIQVQCLLTNSECPPESEEWLRVIQEIRDPLDGLGVRVYAFINEVCHVQHRILSMLYSRNFASASNEYLHLVGALTKAEADLNTYIETTNHAHDLDFYMKNMYASAIIKGYHTVQLLTNYLTHHAACAIPLETLREQRIRCLRKVRRAAQEILDNVPKSFNPLELRRDSSPNALFLAIKLVWPLTAVYVIPSTLPEQSLQAQEVLATIGKEIGIRQALRAYKGGLPIPAEAQKPLHISDDDRVVDIA